MNSHTSIFLSAFFTFVLFFVCNCFDETEYLYETEMDKTEHRGEEDEIELITDTERESTNCGCGLENTLKPPSVYGRRRRKRIISDTQTWPFHRYPWIAQIRQDGEQICAAILINPSYFLTAAHCAEGLGETRNNTEVLGIDAIIAIGSQIKDKQYVVYSIIRGSIHPRYKMEEDRPYYDVALLKVKRPITFSKRIRPICLPSNPRIEKVNTMAMAVGWGASEEGGEASKFMKEVNLPILSNEQCKKGIEEKYWDRIGSFTICAGGQENKDACEGDSGGPLQVQGDAGRWTLVGITSWGSESHRCGKYNKPGIYARVSYFMPWILEETQDSLACTEMDQTRIEPNLIECGLPIVSFEQPKGKDMQKEVSYPWMVRIFYGEEFLGSGVLINRSTILTTTTVIDPWGPSHRIKNLTVTFGNILDGKGDHYYHASVKSVLFHPLANFRFNLCLLKLKISFADFTAPFPPICFSHMKFPFFPGERVRTVVHKEGGKTWRLYKSRGQLIRNSECETHGFRFPYYRVFCVRMLDSENCKNEKSMVVTQKSGHRKYLMGLASSANPLQPCIKVAYDVNWILPWISHTVTLLDRI